MLRVGATGTKQLSTCAITAAAATTTTTNTTPIPVAARSKAWVCGRSLAGIAGSNSAGGIDARLL